MTTADAPRLADLPDMLTVDEAAALFRISRTSAYDAIRAGDLPGVRLGRRLRVPKAALLSLLGAPDRVEGGCNGSCLCTSTAPHGVEDPAVTEAST